MRKLTSLKTRRSSSCSNEDNQILVQDEGLGLGENQQLLGSPLSPVSGSIFTQVSSSGNLGPVSAGNLAAISNLGNLSAATANISLFGDTNTQGSILETSDFSAEEAEIDDTTDEGFIEYASLSDVDKTKQLIRDDEDSLSDPVVNNSAIINPSNQNDNIIGGLNDTEFLFDFSSSNIGGIDVLSDQGTTADDRIFFKNIPDNHAIWLSRDPGNNVGMRIETFNTNNPLPTSYSNNVNSITTALPNGNIGIDDFYFNTDNSDYNSSSSFSYEDFYNLGSSDFNSMAQIITGTTSNDTFTSLLPRSDYKYKFSDYSEFSGDNASPYYHPYDNANLEARIFD